MFVYQRVILILGIFFLFYWVLKDTASWLLMVILPWDWSYVCISAENPISTWCTSVFIICLQGYLWISHSYPMIYYYPYEKPLFIHLTVGWWSPVGPNKVGFPFPGAPRRRGAILALNSDTLKLERQKLLRAQETERHLAGPGTGGAGARWGNTHIVGVSKRERWLMFSWLVGVHVEKPEWKAATVHSLFLWLLFDNHLRPDSLKCLNLAFQKRIVAMPYWLLLTHATGIYSPFLLLLLPFFIWI